MKSIAFRMIVSTMVLFSCKTTEKNGELVAAPKETQNCAAIILDAEKFAAESAVKFKITEAKIESQTLFVTLDYKGTGKEKVDCYWTGAIMKSMPPKANIAIKISKDKESEKAQSRKVCFNLNDFYKQFGNSGIGLLLQCYDSSLFLKGYDK